MELKELKQIMHEKGYSVNYASANGEMASMSKYIENKDIWIHADIYKASDMVILSIILSGIFIIKTDRFAISHPRFEELFEDKLINMAYRAVHSTL